MEIVEIVQLLGAAGVGGLVTQYVSRGNERRSIRAEVRAELADVESLRWRDGTLDRAVHMTELLATRRRFVAAALIAHLPRKLVEEYNRLALAALRSSEESESGSTRQGERMRRLGVRHHR